MKAQFDGRRRQYVPMDVLVAFDDFGTALIEKWGQEGICTWMLFLAACKREPVQGTFTYTTDEEGWGKLGAQAKGLTLDAFFRFTGQWKKTSKRRSGRIRYVRVTPKLWDKWNTPTRQKPRSEAQNTRTKPGESEQNAAPEVEVEVEREVKVEVERSLRSLDGTADLEAELDKLMKLGGTDTKSRAVARSYAGRLPLSTVCRIRQAAAERGKRIGWAINAMKSELEAA